MSKFVIVDGNAIIHRAYHAIPPLTTKEGVMVNAAYGFVSMLLKVIQDIKPEYIAVTFDVAGGSEARLAKFADYKATRVKADQELYDQIPLVHQVVEAFNIPIFEKKGYEADDVIGTIVKQLRTEKLVNEVYVVTGDMDTLQLVDEKIKVYTLRKGLSDIVIYDPEAVRERYGFGPEMVVEYKALRGDTSDNIPGVPGIGEKTATELIQQFGGVDAIYEQLEKHREAFAVSVKPSVLKKLEEGKESAYMSRELATIHVDVPDLNFTLESAHMKPFDREKIVALFQKLEFISLLKRIPGMPEAVKPEKAVVKKTSSKTPVLEEVRDETALDAALVAIKDAKQFAAQVLLSGKDVFSAEIQGIIFVTRDKGWHVTGKLVAAALTIFAQSDLVLVGHDLKQLIKALRHHYGSVIANQLFDVMIAAYLLNPGNRATDIPSIILKVLGKELPTSSAQETLFGINTQAVVLELHSLLLAAESLKKELGATKDLDLLKNIEMPLEFVLAEMELAGVAVDTEMLGKLSKDVQKQVETLTKKIYELAGTEFNIASPIQLREILFEKLEIPTDGVKKGKTGLSTSAEELEKLRGLHPIIDLISEYRELTKLQNTYIDVLPTLINPKTGRIHSSFNQAVAATGRLSSSDPNLQNIPIRTELGKEIRNAFIAEKGCVLIAADYSQIELRIVASLAEDAKMMEIFANDEDIHTATAAAIQGVPIDKVTKDMRRAAKEINFGVLYGMSAHGLAWRAQIPHFQAKQFIDTYFKEFSGVKKYIDDTIAFTKREGYCETLFGRRRYIPELNASNYQLRAAAERMAVNHPVQGTEADLMKIAMIEVQKYLDTHYEKGEARQIMQVHDELVLEVREELAEKISKDITDIMRNVVTLKVPVKVEAGIGKRWGEIK